MYFIELLLTKKCNKQCFYCSTKKDDEVEVDIDYLKWVVNLFPDETGVELTGGEIGLVPNIDDVYRVVKDSPKIKHIIALSNGLLRKRKPDWLKDVEYWEHLIYEIKGKEIIRFYRDLDLEQDHKYVTITTETTTRSLIQNFEYFKELGLFRDNFFYKLLNHKSNMDISKYYDDLLKFYKLIKNDYFTDMLIHYRIKTYLRKEKSLCEDLSPNPYIDLQTKELGHCAININTSRKWEFNSENLDNLRKGFYQKNLPDCKRCYSFDHGFDRNKDNNRSYKRK